MDRLDFVDASGPSSYLANTTLPIKWSSDPGYSSIPRPTHDAAYWAEKTKGFNLAAPDRVGNVDQLNRVIWQGLKGSLPYPERRDAADLRRNRVELLKVASVASAGR